jgi:hypothetical protein
MTAPSRRQEFNYYKITSFGFEGTTLIYTRRILRGLRSTQQQQISRQYRAYRGDNRCR